LQTGKTEEQRNGDSSLKTKNAVDEGNRVRTGKVQKEQITRLWKGGWAPHK